MPVKNNGDKGIVQTSQTLEVQSLHGNALDTKENTDNADVADMFGVGVREKLPDEMII